MQFFQNLFVSRTKKSLGTIWGGIKANNAYRRGELRSTGGGTSTRVAFRNLSPVPLILCWVSDSGQLFHFYKLKPSVGGESTNAVIAGDHVETTVEGHAFCLAYVPHGKLEQARKDKKLDTDAIIGGYRPSSCCPDKSVHLVTISHQPVESEQICCHPLGSGLRKRRKITNFSVGDNDNEEPDIEGWTLKATVAEMDPTPYDTTEKKYEKKVLGGWPVYAEADWYDGDKKLEEYLARHLREAYELLPDHARDYLRENCPIWVNRSIKFGPKVYPMTGRGCCYHPNKDWLLENGLCGDKHLCIEINDGPNYKRDIELWGTGGIMIHELSHAYHHRMVENGYKNKEIEECYDAAMKEGLYDDVPVHGPQGPRAKAYACTNCMEYFAELSTALLGGADDSIEYNKWYPFNRKQLASHDPRAYKLLTRIWKIEKSE